MSHLYDTDHVVNIPELSLDLWHVYQLEANREIVYLRHETRITTWQEDSRDPRYSGRSRHGNSPLHSHNHIPGDNYAYTIIWWSEEVVGEYMRTNEKLAPSDHQQTGVTHILINYYMYPQHPVWSFINSCVPPPRPKVLPRNTGYIHGTVILLFSTCRNTFYRGILAPSHGTSYAATSLE